MFALIMYSFQYWFYQTWADCNRLTAYTDGTKVREVCLPLAAVKHWLSSIQPLTLLTEMPWFLV
jgi:hypothetical protein